MAVERRKQDWNPAERWTETPWRKFRKHGQFYRIRVEYKRDANRGLRMRAEIHHRGDPRWGDWSLFQSGQLLAEIEEHFPELSPFTRWVDLAPDLYRLRAVDWAKEIWQNLQHAPNDAQFLGLFADTIVFGALSGESVLPDLDVPWAEVERWLVARLPHLLRAFRDDMTRLRALSWR